MNIGLNLIALSVTKKLKAHIEFKRMLLFKESAYTLCMMLNVVTNEWLFIHLFIQAISIAPLQVINYSGELPTQHGYCAGISRRCATGNREWKTCPRSLRGGGSRSHDPSNEKRRLYTKAQPHNIRSHSLLKPRTMSRSTFIRIWQIYKGMPFSTLSGRPYIK